MQNRYVCTPELALSQYSYSQVTGNMCICISLFEKWEGLLSLPAWKSPTLPLNLIPRKKLAMIHYSALDPYWKLNVKLMQTSKEQYCEYSLPTNIDFGTLFTVSLLQCIKLMCYLLTLFSKRNAAFLKLPFFGEECTPLNPGLYMSGSLTQGHLEKWTD